MTNSYRGLVGFRIRELDDIEFDLYCNLSNSTIFTEKYNVDDKIELNRNFSYHIFSTGCYYFDEKSFSWSSEGMETMNDSTSYYTHCRATKLGTFSSGYIEIKENEFKPETSINFKTHLIPIICILLFIIFIFLSLWSIYKNHVDSKRIGMTYLVDNEPKDNYKYKITIFTGSRPYSDTDSNIIIVLNGDFCETKPRSLQDPSRRLFRRGGIDCFLYKTKKPLGDLDCIRIWHDNTGPGNSASWFLDRVIIQDLQTNKKYYFLCEKWFAIDKDDYKIERTIPDVGPTKKPGIFFLIKEETKKQLNDNHLILCLFNRPTNSKFTRIERVSCSFAILFIIMLLCYIYVKFGNEYTSTNLLNVRNTK